MEKKSGGDRKSENFQKSDVRTFETKEQKLSDLGLSKQRASEYEQLVKPENRPIVERYIEDTEEAEEIPTISGALKEIKVRQSDIDKTKTTNRG